MSRQRERAFSREMAGQFVERNLKGNRSVRRRAARDLARQIARDVAAERKNRNIETATDKHEGSEDAAGRVDAGA